MQDFLATPIGIAAITLAQTLALLVPVLLAVAYLTYAERKVLGAMQLRRGPNVVGPLGLFQPFADAIKAIMKETIVPSGANRLLFMFAPMLHAISSAEGTRMRVRSSSSAGSPRSRRSNMRR